jgi:CheY-like chemotaxis protein
LDLTGQRSREAANAKLEARLQQVQRLEALGLLAGGVAHDFNNLLTPIMIHAEESIRRGHDDIRTGASLRHIITAASRARELTRQLLAFGSKQRLLVQRASLNDAITGMRTLFTRLLPETIDIELDLSPDLPAVKADPSQLQQVVMNLAVNARDAMATGGRLRFATASVAGGGVELAVSDTGCGIPDDVRARIFEPFFTTKAEGLGHGLGLATVYGIVRQHGGTIEVDSEVGCGTTFTIRLPLAVDEVSVEPPPRSRAERPRHHAIVLVVEDDPLVRRSCANVLEERGMTVLVAADATAALALASGRTSPIDVLVTDVVLPGMVGPALYARLSAWFPRLSVVYVTGYSDDVAGSDVLRSQVVLRKPMSADALVEAVDDALATRLGAATETSAQP